MTGQPLVVRVAGVPGTWLVVRRYTHNGVALVELSGAGRRLNAPQSWVMKTDENLPEQVQV